MILLSQLMSYPYRHQVPVGFVRCVATCKPACTCHQMIKASKTLIGRGVQGLLPLFIETDEAVLLAVWTATGAVTSAVPKEAGPSFVRTLKEGIATAIERQRRKRMPGPLLLPGLCLPKALSPLLPIYLQGVLQVRYPLYCGRTWVTYVHLVPSSFLSLHLSCFKIPLEDYGTFTRHIPRAYTWRGLPSCLSAIWAEYGGAF